MTADLTRRLSSMDFLDEDEHAQLFAWGNRAVLDKPVSSPASIRGCSPARRLARQSRLR